MAVVKVLSAKIQEQTLDEIQRIVSEALQNDLEDKDLEDREKFKNAFKEELIEKLTIEDLQILEAVVRRRSFHERTNQKAWNNALIHIAAIWMGHQLRNNVLT